MRRHVTLLALISLAGHSIVAVPCPRLQTGRPDSTQAIFAEEKAELIQPERSKSMPAVSPDDSSSEKVVRKNPTGAMLRSMVVPGWGQWYNEKRFKAVVIMGAEIGLVIDAVVQNQLAVRSEYLYDREFYRNNRNLAIWWLGAVILYSMADAYVDAHLFDFDERPDLSLGITADPMRGGTAHPIQLNLSLQF